MWLSKAISQTNGDVLKLRNDFVKYIDALPSCINN